MKYFILFFSFLSLTSCGLLSENSKPVNYNSESFKDFEISDAPDYSNIDSWAVHPSGDQQVLMILLNLKKTFQLMFFLSILLF